MNDKIKAFHAAMDYIANGDGNKKCSKFVDDYRPTGWFVFKETGNLFHPTVTEWPIEYATKEEAESMKARLEARADLSFYDPDSTEGDGPILYVAKYGEAL